MRRILSAAAAIVILLAALLVIGYFYVINPGETGPGVGCFTYKVFGVYCAGCGLTRQLHHLLHGDFALAFSYNVLGIIIWPLLALVYIVLVRWGVWDKPLPNLPLWTVITLASVIVVYMVLRNLPVEPFCYLAPPT